MKIPDMPDTFYPDEPLEERINRWLTLEAEAEEVQRHEAVKYDNPRPPKLPFWMRECTNESALRMWGVM